MYFVRLWSFCMVHQIECEPRMASFESSIRESSMEYVLANSMYELIGYIGKSSGPVSTVIVLAL